MNLNSLVIYKPIKNPHFWPNKESAKTAFLFVLNIIFYPATSVFIINGAIRAWNIQAAFQEGNTIKIYCDLLAMTALFFPSGELMAASIDCVSEWLHLQRYKKSLSITQSLPPIFVIKEDPTKTEGAIKILGIDEKLAQDPYLIEGTYVDIITHCSKRAFVGSLSHHIMQNLTETLLAVKTARNTLLRTLSNPPLYLNSRENILKFLNLGLNNGHGKKRILEAIKKREDSAAKALNSPKTPEPICEDLRIILLKLAAIQNSEYFKSAV